MQGLNVINAIHSLHNILFTFVITLIKSTVYLYYPQSACITSRAALHLPPVLRIIGNNQYINIL